MSTVASVSLPGVSRISRAAAALEKYFSGTVTSRILSGESPSYERWRWQYLDNPMNSDEDPSVWIYKGDGKIVAHLGVLPVKLHVGARCVKAGWAVDFFTAPEYRGRGIGKCLIREAARNFDVFLSVGNTAMSFGLFRKMGWQPLGDMPFYIKIWSLRDYLMRKIQNPALVSAISTPFSVLLALYNVFRSARENREIDVARLERFGEEADEFWDKIQDSYRMIVCRDQAYLSWRYDRQPGMGYVKFRASRGGRVCGYLVARAIPVTGAVHEGLIADIIIDPDDKDACRTLLSRAETYLRSEGCGLVRCYATDKRIARTLVRCGYLKREAPMRFMVYAARLHPREIGNFRDWFLTAGDSDIDR